MHKLLLGITCLGFLLRLVNLNHQPLGFTPDEAAFGYNAYSLIMTGRDEWGTPFFSLPYSGLLSFGDDKSPLYALFTVPSVYLFGLTHFSARLPNALFGTLAIQVVYLLTKKIISGNKSISYLKSAPIISALFMAVSPWSVQLSRGAFEANLIMTLLPLSVVAFLSGHIIQSSLISVLSIYSYHSGRFLTLPVILFFAISSRSPLKQAKKFFLVVMVLLIPLIHSSISRPNSRTIEVSILSPDDNWSEVVKNRYLATLNGLPDPIARLIHNRPRALFEKFTHNYIEYFSPSFLFISGPRESTYGMLKGWGVVLPIYIIGITLGLYLVIKKRVYRLAIFALLLLSPVPAALTKGPGLAANRSALFFIPLTILTAFGISKLPVKIRYLSLILGLVYSSATIFNYHFSPQSTLARDMLYGYRELIYSIDPNLFSSSSVLVSRSLSEPHIYFAFYNKISPAAYQYHSNDWKDFQSRGFKFLDQMDGYKLANYTFGSIPKKIPPDTLVISRPGESVLPNSLVSRIYYPYTNQVSVEAYTIRP